MKNTIENKEKFFGLYINQQVLANTTGTKYPLVDLNARWNWRHPNFYLELTPLSDISDVDAIEVGKFMGFDWDNPIFAKGVILQLFVISSGDKIKEDLIMKQMLFDFSDISSTIELIRSKGYAYKWMGVSVEQQIEYGWIKLNKNELTQTK